MPQFPRYEDLDEERKRLYPKLASFLHEAARAPRLTFLTYTECATHIGKPEWYYLRPFWDMLGAISIDDIEDGLGPTSVLVIDRATMRPGNGFYDLVRHFGVEGKLHEKVTGDNEEVYIQSLDFVRRAQAPVKA